MEIGASLKGGTVEDSRGRSDGIAESRSADILRRIR